MTDRTDGGVIGAGRVAVVTGGASGIGRALAERFAAEGSAVVVADLDTDEAEVVAAGIRAAGGEAEVVGVDVSDAAAVDRLAVATLERFGHVDVLCNNAGVSTFNLFRDQTLDDWKWVVGVNFWGVVHGLQTFVPIMREQDTPAHIVNTASIAGLVSGVAFIGPYCATKVAVVSISETLAQELAIEESPIGVSVLCPSSVDTKVMESERGRPAELGVEHRTEMAESVRLMIRDGFTGPTGLTPAQVAARVLDAIRGREFWIITHNDLAATVDTRFDGILAGFPDGVAIAVAWDFETDPEFEEQLAWMRAFVDSELIPLEPIMRDLPREEWAAVKAHLQERVKARGLWGAFLDPELGGAGFGQLKLALMSEIIGRCMMSMTIFGVQAPDSGNMELLAHGATDAQKERWLWPNLRGEISSAFALTEPFLAGADPTVIGTTATRDGDEWVIDGHKWFITNASVADIVLVFAETNPENRPHKHASILIVPAGTPGMEIVRDIGTMAHPEVEFGRTGNHAEVLFRNCRVPADHMIGAPGDGFVLAQQRLGGGRIHHAMRWLGQAQRSLDIMCERAVSRSSHGKLLAQHQMVQDFVALSYTEIQAARLLTFQAAWKMDKYGASAVRADLGMVKAHVSKVVLAVLDRTIQVCGALGYSSDLPVEEWYRGTRFGPIGDGPDELHKSVLARTVLKGYKPVEGWPTEHIPSRRPAAEEKWQELRAAAGIA